MPSLVLLRIDALGLEAFQGGEHPPAGLASFAAGERSAFIDWLRSQPRKARYRLLVDLADESHETETLPRTRGADRRALTGRRLAAWYPQACYARADTLHIDRKANTELILFSGLARPAGVDVWTSALRDAGCGCERLVPASELIAHALRGATRLIVSHSRAGMRLTLVDGHIARLSRLVESSSDGPDRAGWQHEIERTLHYANSLQLQTGEHPAGSLQIAVLSAGPTRGAEAKLQALDLSRHDFHETGMAFTDSSELLLNWLARAPRKLGWPGLSPDAHPISRHARSLALGTGLLLSAGGTGMAGMHWLAAEEAHEHHAALQRETARLQHDLTELAAIHAGLDAPPAQIIDTVKQVAQEQSSAILPLAVLRPIADILDQTPGLTLKTLDWSPAPADTGSHLVNVRLSFAADAPDSHAGRTAVDAFVALLGRRGARHLATQRDPAGDTHIELLLEPQR